MDDQPLAQGDDLLEGYDPFADAPAAADDETDPSLSEEEAPEDADQEDGAEDTPPEDPVEALRLEREARQQLETQLRERADADAQREAERQRAEAEAAEQKRIADRRTARQVYAGKKARLAQARAQDAITAAQASDPALMAQHLAIIRQREEQAIEAEYEQWVETDRQLERAELVRQRDAAATVQYADYVRDAYGLPHDELQNVLRYADGTPVDPKAMSARAAELVAHRRELANLKRQLTREAREDGRATVRGRTSAGPGRGRGAPPPEIEGSLDELDRFWPMGRGLRRVS